MHRLMWLAIAGIVLALPARADWSADAGEDPMTDQKWAAAGATFSTEGVPKVLLKCWEGGHLQLGIVVGPYDDSASYAATVPVKFRVDRNEPVEITAQPINLAGALMLGATNSYEAHLLPLLKSILEAKQRVALSIGEAVYETDVHGSTKAIGPMMKLCGY